MNTFVCPECGHKSTYDPWVEPAHCSQCGYTLPPMDKTLRHQFRHLDPVWTETPHSSPVMAKAPSAERTRDSEAVASSTSYIPISPRHRARSQGSGLTPRTRKSSASAAAGISSSTKQASFDWRVVVRYAAVGVVLGTLLAYGIYRLFSIFRLPSKSLLAMLVFTVLGLLVMADGVRMVVTQEAWIKPSKYAFRRIHVTGFIAVLYGLGSIFLGLLILVVGNPLILVALSAMIMGILRTTQ